MLERLGYFFLIIVLIVYIVLMFVGLIKSLPWGIVGFIAIAGFGLLFIKVLKDRLTNKEDDYYDKNVKK